MKKIMQTKKLVVVLLATLLLTGCGSNGTVSNSSVSNDNTGKEEDTNNTNSEGNVAVIATSEVNKEFSSRDLDVGYEESTATKITLNKNTATVTGNGVVVKDNLITIQSEGTYVITGTLTDGQIIVEGADTDKIQIVFNNAVIHCNKNAPLYIKKADKVFLTLKDGSSNTLTDGSVYELSEEDDNVDGVIFSKADLTINGTGSLTINGTYKHGIVSKDDLVITGGNINITSNGQGLYGKDCVKIKEGTFTLNTKGDGIQSDNSEDSTKGYIYISGGTYSITSATDGIQAETMLCVDGGNINILSGGGNTKAAAKTNNQEFPERGTRGLTDPNADSNQIDEPINQENITLSTAKTTNETETTDTEATTVSTKGLKAGTWLLINGGKVTVDSADDSLHSNGNVTINKGELILTTGDDGIHGENAVVIQDGILKITKSYEGIEGKTIELKGGEIDLISSDDGLNAAAGTELSDGENEFPQRQDSVSSDVFIKISGGTIVIDAKGDGIDSNGNLYVEGGTTYVNGPVNGGNGALDYNGEGIITGGIFVATGSSAMAQGFSDTSKQYSILCNFSSIVSGNSKVTLTDSSGKAILTSTMSKEFQSVVISTKELKNGETYTISAGEQKEEVTITSIVTRVGTSGGDMGNGQRPQNSQGMRKREKQ